MQEIIDGNLVLVEHDIEMGRSVWATVENGNTVYRIDYQVDKMIEENKQSFNESLHQNRGDWVRLASIPHNIKNQAGLGEAMKNGDTNYVKKFLNNSDNAAWRTFRGIA